MAIRQALSGGSVAVDAARLSVIQVICGTSPCRVDFSICSGDANPIFVSFKPTTALTLVTPTDMTVHNANPNAPLSCTVQSGWIASMSGTAPTVLGNANASSHWVRDHLLLPGMVLAMWTTIVNRTMRAAIRLAEGPIDELFFFGSIR